MRAERASEARRRPITPGNERAVSILRLRLAIAHRSAGLVEHAAAVNLGDSGGPLINDHGELAGINIYVDYGRNQAYAAVDVSEILEFMEGVKP